MNRAELDESDADGTDEVGPAVNVDEVLSPESEDDESPELVVAVALPSGEVNDSVAESEMLGVELELVKRSELDESDAVIADEDSPEVDAIEAEASGTEDDVDSAPMLVLPV